MTDVPVVTVPVMYRDADNHKEFTTLYFSGVATDELKARLRAVLDSGEHYIPTQIGHEHLGTRMASWPDQQSDHVWHELDVDEIENTTGRDNLASESFEDFVALIEQNSAAGWDVLAASKELSLEGDD